MRSNDYKELSRSQQDDSGTIERIIDLSFAIATDSQFRSKYIGLIEEN